MEIKIDLNVLVKFSLTLEEYFIMYCINFSKEAELVNYTSKVKKISTEVFEKLNANNLVKVKDFSNITFDSIKLTEQGEKLFLTEGSNVKQDFLRYFEELKATYPGSVMNDHGKPRRLLGDLERCKKLYMNTLLTEGTLNEDLHRNILKVVKLYAVESGKYIQLLSTFLQQKTWEQYLELIHKNVDLNITTKSNFDAV